MTELRIAGFKACQQCGNCCKTPCDLVPADLPPLLSSSGMRLDEFFRKHLIALIVAAPEYANEALMMVPVGVDAGGQRPKKLLADKEYVESKGPCIFLRNGKCSIHAQKPHGGRFLTCAKMTGTVSIQLGKSQYYAYWAKNQHLFDIIVPGYLGTFEKIDAICSEMNRIPGRERKGKAYTDLSKEREQLWVEAVYPLFNDAPPALGPCIFFERSK
jgi:Fe-S-cluster containining protein